MELQVCSAKNKTAKYNNAAAILRIPMFFYHKLSVNQNAETPQHAIALLRCLAPLELAKKDKANSKAPPGSTLGPGIVWEGTFRCCFTQIRMEIICNFDGIDF